MQSWPTVGEPASFECTACHQSSTFVYEPGELLTCTGCGSLTMMPPLPPWHTEKIDEIVKGQTWQHKEDETDVIVIAGPDSTKIDWWVVKVSTGLLNTMKASDITAQYVLVP